jgi:hypothetical protein
MTSNVELVSDVQQLLKMSFKELDELFANSQPGEIPSGETNGTGIIAPGTVCTKEISDCLHYLVWQGKVFDAKTGTLKNKVSPLGLHAIEAKVYKGPSWHDNKECIVIDYSESLLVVRSVRDEMRLIGPQLYLGKVYLAKKPLMHFVLQSVK